MANVSSSNGLEKRPKLRFPGFDEPWKAERLSDFADRVTRKNSKNETDLPLTISSKDGLVDQVSYFNKTVASKDMSGYYLLKNGEFAYNKSYSVGYDFGSIKRLDRYQMGALSTLYICFALKKHDSDFIKAYFDSLKWYREIYMISAEGARNHGLLNVPTDEFFETKHYLPENTDEQRKIADFIIALERRIEAQQSLVDNLKKYKRGVLQKLLDKNQDWTDVPLYRILHERKMYCEKDGSYEHATLYKEGVYGKTERYDRDYLVTDESKQYKITKFGDLCYNPANLKFGVICLNTYGDAIFSPIYVTFEIDKAYDTYFIGQALTRHNFIGRALRYQQGTVYERTAVSPEDLLSMKISIPSLSVQRKISNFLVKVDSKILIEQNLLNNIILQKKQLLKDLFI